MRKQIKKWKNGYVQWHIQRTRIPGFGVSPLIRLHIVFLGKVQKVGFRDEMSGLAERLGITGTVQNRADGSVDAQLQGERDRVVFLIETMKGLKRARVRDIQIKEMDRVLNETGFTVLPNGE